MNTVQSSAEELSWKVDGLTISGLRWGRAEGRPVLALHGWLDHADSFQLLAPKLAGCNVVAPDLPGHGKSDHKSQDAFYSIWSDLPQIIGLLEQLGWLHCVLLGHSRGAIISLVLAAIFPERFSHVIVIDALLPQATPSEHVVEQMRDWLKSEAKLGQRGARYFAGAQEYVDRRSSPTSSSNAAQKLAERALEETSSGFRLRADTRLKAASPIKLNNAQIETILASVEAPILSIWGSKGSLRHEWLRDMNQRAQSICRNYTSKQIEGDHHLHLQHDAIAKLIVEIEDFLSKNVGGPAAGAE